MNAKTDLLQINEVFGPTMQGEGPNTGRHCIFIRTAQCNLNCWFCDTPYTWATTDEKAMVHREHVKYSRTDEEHPMTSDEVLERAKEIWDVENKPTLIVMSGGEPMMQQKNLLPVIDQLLEWGNQIEFETAGTIPPIKELTEREGVRFNVSPKLEGSKNLLKKRRKVPALTKLASDPDTAFKFVICNEDDLREVDEIVELLELTPERVWAMPEGVEPETVRDHAQWLAPFAMERKWNFSMRVHISIWGTTRGV